jgi:hypothetical protein
MDIEKLLFLIIAIALSVFSMYRKSKKQKQQQQQSIPKREKFDYDFPQQQDPYTPPEPVVIFEQFDIPESQPNYEIYTKKSKKKQKLQNIKAVNFQAENLKNISQDADLENDILLLEDFEGTEIQKAFLYSEIFKNAKN